MNGRVYDPVLGRFLSADPYVDDAGDSQAYNRYTYVSNNPLGYTDPSGYIKLSFKTILKIVAVVVIAYFTAGAAISAWGTTMTGSMATGFTVTAGSTFATMMPVAIGNGIIGGLAGGFASGFAGSLLNGGSIGDAFKAGVIGGVAGAVGGGIAGAFSDAGLLTRTLAASAVGGATSEAMGGKFGEGALIAAGVTLAADGFQRMRDFTDENARRAAESRPDLKKELLAVDGAGELQTAGVLPTKSGDPFAPAWLDRAFKPVNKAWELASMKGQGSGKNWFERLGRDGPINRFIQSVSKVHDWMNSWGYDRAAGLYVSRGNTYDSLFSTYSWAAMPPAAIYTLAAQQSPNALITATRSTERERP
jgi:hypothetical protein